MATTPTNPALGSLIHAPQRNSPNSGRTSIPSNISSAEAATVSPDWFLEPLKLSLFSFQEYCFLVWRALQNMFVGRTFWADLMIQADTIGVGSVPIIFLTGIFTGGVLSLQSSSALSQFGALSETAMLVAKSVVKELGPVITALMVSGRTASGIASELGSMCITDQIDAMRSLGTDPYRKLVAPRVLATTIMLFFLTIISDTAGIGGGALVSVFLLNLNGNRFIHQAYQCLNYGDLVQGLIKPLFFGFIISTVGCTFGMHAKGGTQGVGRSTTRAVVYSSVLIIMVDFLISRTMIAIYK